MSVNLSVPIAINTPMDVSECPCAGYVYAVEYDDGIVKIGHTRRPEQRLNELYRYRRKSHKITRVYITISVFGASACEYRANRGLKPCFGKEFFDVPFDDAVSRIVGVVGNGIYWRGDNPEAIQQEYPNVNYEPFSFWKLESLLMEVT